MSGYVNLRQLAEMFLSLPEDVLAKRIGYLDLGSFTQEDLDDLKRRLIEDKDNTWIEQCCN
jgi:hypothetical protein